MAIRSCGRRASRWNASIGGRAACSCHPRCGSISTLIPGRSRSFFSPSAGAAISLKAVARATFIKASRKAGIRSNMKTKIQTFSSISNAELIGAYIKGFMNRYPFIKAEFYRGSGNQLVVRTMLEHKLRKLDADVISVGTENVMALKRAGIWARYHSPEAQFYPPPQHDREGYFHADSLGLATIAYNHQLVKKEEAPKGYNDLLDPKWKGSLTIDLEPERALLAWLEAWGEAKTRDFVQKLLANGASVRRGHTLQAQLLCAGEFKVAVEIYPDAILRMKQKGCPATIVFPNPTPALAGGNYGINVNAPHPHAAALFVDFVLSADGAKILSGTGRIPTRKGARSVYEEL